MVIMVINMTIDELTNDDDETRLRMRKRFQELDEQKRKQETARSAWVMILYFGFLITYIGAFMILLTLGIVPLSLEIVIASGVILFGALIMAIAVFVKNSPSLILDEL